MVSSTAVKSRPTVVCLMGTTATGKTDAAAYLSECWDAEIISVDSALVYEGMDIGTAKPDQNFLERYPHHLVDIRKPDDIYSVADFYTDCTKLIHQIVAKGRVPILAGGTMFYYNALEHGLSQLPQADAAVRAEIEQEAKRQGWPSLHKKLSVLDSDSANRIDPNDAQRIQRALEIVTTGGKTVAEFNKFRRPALDANLLKINLNFSDRKFLHQRIEQRFDIMLEMGLKEEVRALLDKGYDPDLASMRMIGYRQMVDHLLDKDDFDSMRAKGIAATRQLAKRQLTWMRNQANVVWWTDHGLVDKRFSSLESMLRRYLV